jgi:hypothetical protein
MSAMDSLHSLACMIPTMHTSVRKQVMDLIPSVIYFVKSSDEYLRTKSAIVIATLCKHNPVEAFQIVITDLLPVLGDTVHVVYRTGAAECVESKILHLSH